MKSRLQSKKKTNGFTIVEVVISILIFSAFTGILMYLYARSNDTFKITVWKQERTAQSEIFWAMMRKHLEEATNEIVVEKFVENPDITYLPKSLKFHPDPNSVDKGNILAWNCSKAEFDFSPSHNHKVTHTTLFLKKDKKNLHLTADRNLATLKDVDSIEFKVNAVKKAPDNEEFIADGPDPDSVGTILEISLVLSPPEGYMAKDLKIPQSHKFRLNVGAISDTSPDY
ncbi:MAG: hypothetical protein Kow0029_01280 [Candidatus Rifleibacteriota bacterium]